MGILEFFRRHARGGNENTELMDVSLASLDLPMNLAAPLIAESVKEWDLENPNLLMILGYLSGYVDAAYQLTRPSRYDERYVENLFHAQVAKYLSGVSGVDSYLKLSELSWGGSSIGGMQEFPQFMEGTMAGGTDFVNFINRKAMPLGLAQLLERAVA